MIALLIVFIAVIVLVAIANRINMAYPIVLVLGGMALGYIPHIPTMQLQPDLVLVVFLPPLLYWESVTAPTSEFRSGALGIFQLAFGLVIATTLAVAAVAHAVVPGMPWAVALVLGAIVSSTDEVAFSAIADRLNVPRHVIGLIEGESLINDATSLILYGVAIAAVVGATFSLAHAAGALALSVTEAIAIGLAAGGFAVLAWRSIKDDTLQGAISVVIPFVAYLPAYYIGASGVLSTVVAGLFVNRYTPTVLLPRSRELVTGFWVTIVFLLNAFIFVEVGIRFHSIVVGLVRYPLAHLLWYGLAVSLACIAVRLAWTFGQAFLPFTLQAVVRRPPAPGRDAAHAHGERDWSHVSVVAWTGMRGGVSLAAAIAIPLSTSVGPFPERDLVIFITFCVLLATLVGQGGTLPYVIRALRVKDDGANEQEERRALAATAKAALKQIDALQREGTVPVAMLDALRVRFRARWAEFGSDEDTGKAARTTALYRKTECDLLETERKALVALRNDGKIDNTVMRRIQRLLDLEVTSIQLLGTTGQSSLDD